LAEYPDGNDAQVFGSFEDDQAAPMSCLMVCAATSPDGHFHRQNVLKPRA
jgi:hypothetical protein